MWWDITIGRRLVWPATTPPEVTASVPFASVPLPLARDRVRSPTGRGRRGWRDAYPALGGRVLDVVELRDDRAAQLFGVARAFLGSRGKRTLFGVVPARAVGIRDFSAFTGEEEFILAPGTQLKVTEVKAGRGGLCTVKLTELEEQTGVC